MRKALLLSFASILGSLALAAEPAKDIPNPRPEWVIWAALGGILLVLFFILLATQGGWRGKSGKSEPPYF